VIPVAVAGLGLPPQWLGFLEVIHAMALPTAAAGLALPPQWLGLHTGINWWMAKHLT